jgi:hypothetical protein
LRQRKSSGRKSKLTAEVKKKLKLFLDRDVLAAGFPTDRRTLVRVHELLNKEFGISYHPNALGQVPDEVGYSVQKLLPRAAERDEELVKAWLAKDWPRGKSRCVSALSSCSSMNLASLTWNHWPQPGRGKANDQWHGTGGFCRLQLL